MFRASRVLHLLSVVFLLPLFVTAQENSANQPAIESPQEKRPRAKIGVALEGGGALGLAHIGVLQWFEDHHIPIDYIAGTSMGGLVGGLYATGKTPKELQEIVEQQNWDIIIGGQTPYEDLSFRRKEDDRDYPTFNRLYLEYFPGDRLPARTTVGVTRLARGGIVEIDMIAYRPAAS